MTDTAHSSSFFWDSLANATKEVLSQIAGCAVQVDVTPSSISASALEVPFVAEGALAGGFALRFEAPAVAEAAALLMGDEPAKNASPTDDQREATIELSRQICGYLAISLRARFGSLELRSGNSSESADMHSREYRAHVGDRQLSFHVLVSEEFTRSLQQNEQSLSQARVASSGSDSENSGNSKPEETLSKLHDTNLSILLDIELPVTLRFGCREMLLKDVMELTSGSVVELDRRVREPVDLLIDNKLIARGEVVLVEGNYGLRVLEVANERVRLACLP